MLISNAVGTMWNIIELSKNVTPLHIAISTGIGLVLSQDPEFDQSTHLVPRSMALVNPPVCLVKWNFKSRSNRCSKVLRAMDRTVR